MTMLAHPQQHAANPAALTGLFAIMAVLMVMDAAKAIYYGGELTALVALVAMGLLWDWLHVFAYAPQHKAVAIVAGIVVGIVGLFTVGLGTAISSNGYWVRGNQTTVHRWFVFAIPGTEAYVPATFRLPGSAEDKVEFADDVATRTALFYISTSDVALDPSSPALESLLIEVGQERDPAQALRQRVFEVIRQTITQQHDATWFVTRASTDYTYPDGGEKEQVVAAVTGKFPIIWYKPTLRVHGLNWE